MTITDDSGATMTAVMTEAGATVCRHCGKAAAVRIDASPLRANQPAAPAGNVTWLCFECGHEDRRSS